MPRAAEEADRSGALARRAREGRRGLARAETGAAPSPEARTGPTARFRACSGASGARGTPRPAPAPSRTDFSRTACSFVRTSYDMSFGRHSAKAPTAATHSTPPVHTDARTESHAAVPPARTCPSCGPTEYDNSSIPASRPRSSSGIVWFHIAARKIPLTMSKHPPKVRKSSTSHTS